MLDNNGNSGAAIEFDHVTSSGYTHNAFGNGNMDISMHRPGDGYKWLDVLAIHFTQPTADQFMDCMTAPGHTEETQEKSNMFRRLSFVQANYIKDIVIKALEEEFAGGVIPSDEEIKQILADAPPKPSHEAEHATVEPVEQAFISYCFIDTETFPWEKLPNIDKPLEFVIAPAVRNGNGDLFCVGEKVGHQGASDGEIAIIEQFTLDCDNRDIIAHTTRGRANVQFLLKLPVVKETNASGKTS